MQFINLSFVFLKLHLEMVVCSNDTQNVVLHDVGVMCFSARLAFVFLFGIF